jgi:hypothetical protein
MDFAHQQRKAQELNPHPAIVRLRQKLAEGKLVSQQQLEVSKINP